MTEGPPNRVLVGVDSDRKSDQAIRAALDMNRKFGSRLQLVHAVDIPRPEDVASLEVAGMSAEIEAATFERLAAQIQELFDAESYTEDRAADVLEVTIGHPSRVLIERAADTAVDLIVMGKHEKHGFFDFGSTVRPVLAKAACHLWVQPAERRPIHKILVPVDLSEDSRAALRIALKWAEKTSASVTALHCFMPPELAYAPTADGNLGPAYVVNDVRDLAQREFEEAMDAFDWGGVEHERLFIEGLPVGTILELQDAFDLIAMGSHGRTGLSAAVLGNVAYSTMKEARIPVLAIRQPNRRWLL